MIGQIINYRYEVLEKIGDGEIFSVYKSRDKVLNRLVALKVLNKEFAENRKFATAVRSGYQSVAALDHPNITRVLEADPVTDEPFVACEFVRGMNIKDRVRRAGSVQVQTALDIMIPVLEALEYAHANRIVHGDLRPQDIVVGSDGGVKVTDFGLSSALLQHPEIADKVAMRSVHYEAPEIAEGAQPSVASDIYSAGVILYEMLTGSLPFEGATAISVALKQAKDEPVVPRTINTAIPKSLSDLVMTAIEKSPAERFPNVSAMLANMRAIRDSLRVGKPYSMPQSTVSGRMDREDTSEAVIAEEGLPRSSYLWLTLIFIVVVMAVGGLTLHLNLKDSKITVPPLLGMTVDEARYQAKQVGITLIDDGEVFSNDVEKGKIADLSPLPNAKVPRSNPVVKYKVSKGPSAKAVPDLVGLPESEANQAIEDEGFAVGKVTTEYSDKVPMYAVIRQSPEHDSMAPPGSSVDMVVSLGSKTEPAASTDNTNNNTSETTGQQRKFKVAVDVPADADGAQEVRIIVNDDRGENTAIQEFHDPGDKFSQLVTTYGDNVRIRVYVGGRLMSDETY